MNSKSSSLRLLVVGDSNSSPNNIIFSSHFEQILNEKPNQFMLKLEVNTIDLDEQPIPLSGIFGVIGVFATNDKNSIQILISSLQNIWKSNAEKEKCPILLLIGISDDDEYSTTKREVNNEVLEIARQFKIHYWEGSASSIELVTPLLKSIISIKHFQKKQQVPCMIGDDQENINPNITPPIPNNTTTSYNIDDSTEEEEEEGFILSDEKTYFATTKKIITQLFSTEANPEDGEYWKIVLFTWPTFITNQQILDEISLLWENSSKKCISPNNETKTKELIIKFIKKMVKELESDELEQDILFKSNLISFAKEKISKFDTKKATSIENNMIRRNYNFVETQKKRSLSEDILVSYLPYYQNMEKKNILDIEPIIIAKQLTLIDWRLFSKIKVKKELFNTAWMKDGGKQGPNVLAIINRTNHVSEWVVTEIVQHTKDIKKRVKTIKWFIKLADSLRELNNFNGVMYIIAGLNNCSVIRLKYSWKELDNNSHNIFFDLENLISFSRNYHEYRTAISENLKRNIPTVPMLSVTFTGLCGIQENSDGEKGKINFTKRTILYKLLFNEVIYFQKMKHSIIEDTNLIEKLNNLPIPFDEKIAYQLSQKAEPAPKKK